MSDVLRCSDMEGRRVYRARRPSSHRLRKASKIAGPDGELRDDEVVEEFVRVGKVRACVFHPKQRRCVGVLIRRPDALWMFHRSDLMAPLDKLSLEDKNVLLDSGGAHDAKPSALVGDTGCKLADCVIWTGLDIVTKNGTQLGYVGDVTFDATTGLVESVTVGEGGASQALLGAKVIPAAMISGFTRGVGSELVDDHGRTVSGAIVVDDGALERENEGGLADAAGKAAAVAMHKVSKATASVKPVITEKASDFKAKYIDVDDDEEAAAEDDDADGALERGARAVGKQLKRAQGMFGDFLDEYRKARDE